MTQHIDARTALFVIPLADLVDPRFPTVHELERATNISRWVDRGYELNPSTSKGFTKTYFELPLVAIYRRVGHKQHTPLAQGQQLEGFQASHGGAYYGRITL